jgi:sporulation protein YlmC with PRC-barrel domain
MLTRSSVMSSDEITGTKVRNLEGENIGKIEEIVLDLDIGMIRYAVMSFGGFLGIGDKLFAVPWKSLQYSDAEGMFILDAHKDRLKNAPGFDKDRWPNLSDTKYGSTVHEYYGVPPWWQ